jgi:hypothetical protein
MKNKRFGFILVSILFLTALAKADAPPPKGYTRVSVNFVVETKEDLSDYKFFFNFYGNLHEIEIKKDEKNIITPIGSGARYATGTFIAIQKKNLPKPNDKLTAEDLDSLGKLIDDKEIKALIELGQHSFWETVLTKNSKKVSTPSYLIKRKGQLLTMSQKKKILKKASFADEEQSSGRTMMAGIFLSLSIVFGGVFIFRRDT